MKLPRTFRFTLFFAITNLCGCDDHLPFNDSDLVDADSVVDADVARDADSDTDGDAGTDADFDRNLDGGDGDLVEPEWPLIEEGQLHAGRADGTLDLPIGTPMAAYGTRSRYFGGDPVDDRDSPYTWNFVPSAGVQTRIPLRVIWLEAGDQQAVIVKIDLAYAFDGLVNALERTISAASGRDVTDHVVLITSHSHASYGAFSQAHHLFLGHDRYLPEILDRIVRQAATLAATARERLVPAAVGVGIFPDFDPEDRIYRNRRGETEGLIDAFGMTVSRGYKDPNLYLIRIDASQGTDNPDDDLPLAVLFGWGIHGTIMGEENPLLSSETTGAIELKLENHFSHTTTCMHFQVDGGDMSPAATHDDFAMMEELAERAVPQILELWEATETTSGPLHLETLVRTIPTGRDIRVTRDGDVDLHYLPFDEDYEPDLEIFGTDGSPLNPFDEFTAPFGAGQCGEDTEPDTILSMGVDVYPYSSCIRTDTAGDLMLNIMFSMTGMYELEFPLWETRSTMIAVISLDRVPVTTFGDEVREDSVVLGFLPGEPGTMLGRSLQQRGTERHGLGTVIPVGFAMDHEGYLLTVDDWMQGGYESSINLWGPLHGEYIVDQLLELADLAVTDEAEDPSWPHFLDQTYPEWPMEPAVPEISAGCGGVPDNIPDHLFTRDGWRPDQTQPSSEILRVSGIAHFLFRGGDPVVDTPTILLQREATADLGDFVDVLLPNGQPLSDRGYDMIVTYTPSPLTAAESTDRDHLWLVEWQAVTDRPSLQHMAGVTAGRYRFAVSGRCADPDELEYPFEGVPYELFSEPFEVTGEGALEVSIVSREDQLLTIAIGYHAAPRGYRLLHMSSGSTTASPVVGGDSEPTVTVELVPSSGGEPLQRLIDLPAAAQGDSSIVIIEIESELSGECILWVEDSFGNRGSSTLTL